MKRTPLVRHAGLARTRGRPKRLRRPAMSHDLREAVWARAGGRCDCCGTRLHPDTWQAHHRRLRSRGGEDSHENLLALTPLCHEWVHAHPARATELGLMLSATANPAASPFYRHATSWQYAHAGGYRAAARPDRTTP